MVTRDSEAPEIERPCCPLCGAQGRDLSGLRFVGDTTAFWNGIRLDWRDESNKRPYGMKQLIRILYLLYSKSPNVVTHAELIDYIWGNDPDGGPLGASDCVKVYVSHLRRVLEAHKVPVRVVNVFSRGYMLVAEVKA